MAKLFIGIALALMLATAALGFLAKGNIDKLKSTLTEKRQEVDKQKADLRKADESVTTAKAELEAANAKAQEAKTALDTKTSELTAATDKLSTATAALETKTKEATDLQAKLDDAMKGSKPVVPVGDDPRIAAMTADLQKAQAEVAEQKALVDAITKKGEADAQRVVELEKKEKLRAAGVTRPGLTGKILAVNPGWNFVVISVGDRQGVMVNSPLLVLRGNTPVARLRITSVEPAQSIADVIPGSVARGVTVQPGDTVIFEGRSETSKPEGETSTTPPLPAR
jgi:hypothetical protein